MAVPVATPVTMPVPEPTVAYDTSVVLHVPPVVASLSVVVVPIQVVAAPVTGSSALTVTAAVLMQPDAAV